MQHAQQHYVNGAWVDPIEPTGLDVFNPATEEAFVQVAVGGPNFGKWGLDEFQEVKALIGYQAA